MIINLLLSSNFLSINEVFLYDYVVLDQRMYDPTFVFCYSGTTIYDHFFLFYVQVGQVLTLHASLLILKRYKTG